MAGKVVAMQTRLLAVFTAGLDVDVSALCAQLGVSRQTFYKYRRRFAAEGSAGLVERSRRPHRSPGQVAAGVEDEIVRLRKQLTEAGLDAGAQSIRYRLQRRGGLVPSVATIHRVLTRRGMVTPQPHKRPRSATRRFVWPQPNDAWQIDATSWVLSGGRQVWVMDVIDDHSRLLVAARACEGPTSAAAWDALSHGAQRWGFPAHVMSDNGACFTGRLISGGETDFERTLRQLGIRHIPSSPGHPQTCGKLERFHQTLKKRLAAQPDAENLDELQNQLDWFVAYYNTQRPHRALRGATPLKIWQATDRAHPAEPIAAVPDTRLLTIDRQGRINWTRYQIQIGSHLAGQQVLVIARGDHVTIVGQPGILHQLTIDPTRRYQPNHQPPGRRPRPANPIQ